MPVGSLAFTNPGLARPSKQVLVLPFVKVHKSPVRAFFNALNDAVVCAVFARARKGGSLPQPCLPIPYRHWTDRKRLPLSLRHDLPMK